MVVNADTSDMMELPGRRGSLRDYTSVLQRGWAVAPEQGWSEAWEVSLRRWVDALAEQACLDGLALECSIGWDVQLDGAYSAAVWLNWPDGRRSHTTNATRMPALLERAWGQTLMRARARLKRDLGTVGG